MSRPRHCSQKDSLFASKLDNGAIETMDLGDASAELVMTDSIQEKFNKLDIEAELQVSLLSGLVKLGGSGAYIGEEKKSARAQSMSLLYKLQTVSEEIMIRHHKDKIDVDILSHSNDRGVDATHVVVAIAWGAVISVTCEYQNKNDEDVNEAKGSMKAELEKIKSLITASGSANVSYDDRSKDISQKFTFKCKSDVSAPEKDLPVTFEGAVELAKSLPSLIQGKNNGKGVPLSYMLMPLNAVVKICKLQIQINVEYKAIGDDTITKCSQIVESITKKRQTLYDIQSDLHACSDYVAEEPLSKIDAILDKFIVDECSFKSKLQNLVTKVRSGQEDVSGLNALLSDELSTTFPVSVYNDQIRSFQKDFNRVKNIKSWKSKGIVYVGRKDHITVDDKRNVYVLYKSSGEHDKENHDKNLEFFLKLQRTHMNDGNRKFVVIDEVIRRDLWQDGVEKTHINMFVDGSQITSDLYAKEGKYSDMCLIKMTPTYCQMRTANRAFLLLRCPNALSGNGQCSGDPKNWMCSKCKSAIEYGIDTELFYCKCGKSRPIESFFRCNEKDHGMHYIEYPQDILRQELSGHRATKGKNILILGETGVGKSTWINGFVNYLLHSDMNEAINADELKVLIPSSFTITQNGEERKIMVGAPDSNETMEVGKSATNQPRSYGFYLGEEKITLIDTPGVGDSRGIDHDKKNFENILCHLTFYDEIHAVCILLKPNNARLSALFRFCIQELLAHLHSSAKDNIVFCFTHSRATFYKPGDTLPPLNKELKERKVGIQATLKNYFCFDNESFRFLACLKNGVHFSEDDIKTYSDSWDKSVKETKRLLEHINNLEPHNVKHTLNMNEARRTIVAMSKPLAEVAGTIQKNLLMGEVAKEQIDLCDEDMNSLRAALKFSGYDLERVEIAFPMTVCAHPACIKHVAVGKNNIQNTLYQQICHSHCYLDGIPTETINDTRLQGCLCIGDGNNCLFCGHHYSIHMHITYTTKLIPREFLSEKVQAQINAKKSDKDKKEAFKRAIDNKNKELEQEKNTIVKTSAKYGSFLKTYAIIPYNDAVGDYLDMCIEQEQEKAKEIRNKSLLKKMRQMKSQYEQERELLDNAITEGENINTPEEVDKLQRELFNMKHMGKTIKALFDGISISRSANNVLFEEKVVLVPPNKKGNAITRFFNKFF
ncbi:Neoverrucotoxin subunit beta [Holothuria leucospilota]|uniref:Neoverrucotoxin subunit beta n=1 Tax=Holothuria leucospilota TaxID=206669 RepID=A0A9Q1BY39_HOLLE|nr:Neoverrucotoxin subunit beta [Holothuria leucospilota]